MAFWMAGKGRDAVVRVDFRGSCSSHSHVRSPVLGFPRPSPARAAAAAAARPPHPTSAPPHPSSRSPAGRAASVYRQHRRIYRNHKTFGPKKSAPSGSKGFIYNKSASTLLLRPLGINMANEELKNCYELEQENELVLDKCIEEIERVRHVLQAQEKKLINKTVELSMLGNVEAQKIMYENLIRTRFLVSQLQGVSLSIQRQSNLTLNKSICANKRKREELLGHHSELYKNMDKLDKQGKREAAEILEKEISHTELQIVECRLQGVLLRIQEMEYPKVESDAEAIRKAEHSLFFVEIIPKEDRASKEMHNKFIKDVVKREKTRGMARTAERYSTGFVVAAKGNKLRLLTCAHSMDDIFTSRISPKTKDLNTIFQFNVICFHIESKVVQSSKTPLKCERSSMEAVALAVDTELDLLVLEVDLDQDNGKEERCSADHPVIKVSPTDPAKGSMATLIGWPPQRSSASVLGHVSHSARAYDAVTGGLNKKGYTMRFLEVDGMLADKGFSGGMIINNQSDCIGLYHGTGDMTGYGVSCQDLKLFLAKHKVCTFSDEAEEEGVDKNASQESMNVI